MCSYPHTPIDQKHKRRIVFNFSHFLEAGRLILKPFWLTYKSIEGSMDYV